jgi:hypothetical protein
MLWEGGERRVICAPPASCDFAVFSSQRVFQLESRDWILRDDGAWWQRPSWWAIAGGFARGEAPTR